MVRRTLALAALLVLTALSTAPASAGGPTSVVLSAPPNVTAFGYDDPRYDALRALTEPNDREPGGDHRSGRFVRATWLIHDMSVWRIDIIYPDAPGGPWILTELTMGEVRSTSPTWHRATDPTKLVRLLSDLNLLSGEFQGGPAIGDGYAAPEATPETAAEPEPAPAPAAQVQSTSVFTGWRWSIPGVLFGAALAVVAFRLFPKRRWELID
ncbi:hypothetical protein [Kribbella shirazensis]|uniref:Uncharacterized protein n=1 Tax=Kribbella shirazensis TaxID=1105143 RepID=A0A7X6A3Q2_9ACTN|nr:hypothetical protein [Kribbella shirazensis]NIK60155.1 hypothetical protein [Kribbella shirazensis]